ncbi:MAG: ubiquinol-cytochrome c reductase iron-sulfur subunit [Thermoanaerobaculia bacterium]
MLNWFLGTSVGALAASVVYPVARFVSPPHIPEAQTNEVEAGLTNDPELLDKSFKIVRFGAVPVILVRVAEGDYRAFSATCTHLDCIVDYPQEKKLIWCWCHNGVYDLTGRNIAGPPPRPLTPFEVHLVPQRDGQARKIVISKA